MNTYDKACTVLICILALICAALAVWRIDISAERSLPHPMTFSSSPTVPTPYRVDIEWTDKEELLVLEHGARRTIVARVPSGECHGFYDPFISATGDYLFFREVTCHGIEEHLYRIPEKKIVE